MSIERTLQVEVTVVPPKRRRSGQQRGLAGPGAPDPPCITRTTRLMALAIKLQDMVDRGEVRDYADVARLGYVSRARITQIMNLLTLAPELQEALLFSEPAVAGIRERHLRKIVAIVDWYHQRQELPTICNGSTVAGNTIPIRSALNSSLSTISMR